MFGKVQPAKDVSKSIHTKFWNIIMKPPKLSKINKKQTQMELFIKRNVLSSCLRPYRARFAP